MAASSLKSGDRLMGRYELLRVVGTGGMGHVFAARRLALDDVVAIKCVHDDRLDDESRARFLREARAMARIHHPNVVQVFDFGDPESGPPFLVMEFLEGPTLAQLVREHGRLPVARVKEIFADLCAAVEAGHRRGVIHRDLKPGNIVLSRDDDGGETLKVLDFGLARFVGEAAHKHRGDQLQTQAGVLMGTSAYMSPEQIESGEAGPPSDVFALGVILYELLTGELPFRGPNPVATIMRITSGEYTPPEKLVPELPAALCSTIAAALERDPADRPGSPRDLAKRLRVERPERPAPLSRGPASSQTTGDLPGATPMSELRARPASSGAASDANVTRTHDADVLGGPLAPRIFGRSAEVEALFDALAAAQRSRRPRVSLVTGAPGMGKSAVIESYRGQAMARGAKVYRARFYAYEGDRPPPNETFLWMLGDSDARSSHGAGGRPAEHPIKGKPATEGGAAAANDADAAHAGDKWRAFEQIGSRFLQRAGGQALVLIFDDLQWATRLELDCIGYLLRAFDGHAVQLIVTAREDAVRPDSHSEASRWLVQLARQNPGALSRVPLAPLSRDALRRWLEAQRPGLRPQPGHLRRLRRATGGNPHYFTELVRQLEARGALRERADGWTLDLPAQLELPESVAQAVLANLAELSDASRQVAELASVIGEELRFETLQVASGIDESELEAILEAPEMAAVLTERGTSAGADYRFVSPTIRGVLYDAMSRRRRRRAHRDVVGALETLYAGDPQRIAKILCYHFDAIEDWPRAMETGMTAAISTLAQFDADNAELALRRVQRAIEGLEEAGEAPDRARLGQVHRMRGTLFARLGRHQAAEDALSLAAEVARERGAVAELVDIDLTLAECELGRGELNRAVLTCERAMQAAESLPPEQGLARWEAAVKSAGILARLGRYDEAEVLLVPLLEVEGDASLARLQAQAHREQAWMLSRRGELEAAALHAEEAMRLARRHRDPYARYLATSVQGVIEASRGKVQRAIELYEEALRMARALSLRRREMIELANSAMAYLQLGDDDEALRRMLQTRALCRELGDRASEGDSWVGMGRVLKARGALTEARDALDRGRELCEAAGRSEYAALASLEMGLVELERAEHESAITLLERAKHSFETSNSVYLWRVYEGLAKALIVKPERRDEAVVYGQKALSRVRELCTSTQGTHSERALWLEAEASLRELLQRTQA